MELEHGVDAWRSMMTPEQLVVYSPYRWIVRHFAEGQVAEVVRRLSRPPPSAAGRTDRRVFCCCTVVPMVVPQVVAFDPFGKPYSFDQRLPEADPGPALPEAEARALAEGMTAGFEVDLAPYTPIEHKQKDLASVRQPPAPPSPPSAPSAVTIAAPSLPRWPPEPPPHCPLTAPSLPPVPLKGRRDHTFTYELRPNHTFAVPLGDGKHKLSLEVAGDKVVALRRYVDIPEAFERR